MKKIQKRIKELEKRISKDRLTRNKEYNYYQCKLCKRHVDDCFCPDDAKLELKGIKFVLHNMKEKRK